MFVVWYSVLVFLHQAGDITASVRWPVGFYGLLKPKTGCPAEWKEKQWEQYCSIYQDTVNLKPNNGKSKVLHIDGYVDNSTSSVQRYFCIKTTSWSGPPWPKGQYCIYGGKFELPGMHSGVIRMHNELNENQDSASISCKNHFVDISYRGYRNKYIDFHFSCQTSGNKKIPISLPITKPFYLLPYGSRDCQQVKWMVATSEWIKYHTRDYSGYHNLNITQPFPHHELGADSSNKGIKMYYCYYESCNHTLNDTKGVFQSPGFPGKYPDGQLCSWRIMVPDNHILHVHFTNFSLYEYDKDCLQLYENKSGIFEPRQSFFGYKRPFTITATRDVMFVFRSDEENNSTGFSANYTIFKIPERTTTLKPPTTNVNSTTNITVKCNSTTKDKSHHKRSNQSSKKTWFYDETWRIVVMVIPLAVFILIVLVTIDIFCRYRGNIILDQSTDTVTNETTVPDQQQSRDDPLDYEYVDYTELNEIPPPRRSSKRQECHALQSVSNDTSSVFYHVLEPPKTESDRPQSQVPEPVGNGAPEAAF